AHSGPQLVAEATCPLCLDVFEQPVLTACGHSFCGQCLAGVLGDPPRPAACPQCRARLEPGSQRPNRALGNVAGLARSLEEVAARPRCPQHGKALALFCEPCAALLCAPCRDGPEHGRHRVRPAEEAARELRVRGGAARGAGGLGRGWGPWLPGLGRPRGTAQGPLRPQAAIPSGRGWAPSGTGWGPLWAQLRVLPGHTSGLPSRTVWALLWASAPLAVALGALRARLGLL
uniref:Uncharacterized protein n=1 Tax=Geospiza parvula TaxID=87175 RepID=A0A8U8BXC7_GEOPR